MIVVPMTIIAIPIGCAVGALLLHLLHSPLAVVAIALVTAAATIGCCAYIFIRSATAPPSPDQQPQSPTVGPYRAAKRR
ncbi:MAG: hypothetical protein V1723_01140 [Candidatus Uhrbacteria bacterium]